MFLLDELEVLYLNLSALYSTFNPYCVHYFRELVKQYGRIPSL